jgi:hypothetical protein
MGAASRQFVSEHTVDQTLDSFESLYRMALGQRQAVTRRANPAVA